MHGLHEKRRSADLEQLGPVGRVLRPELAVATEGGDEHVLRAAERLAVYRESVSCADAITQCGGLAVNTDPARFYPTLHFPARTEARPGQDFLQFFSGRRFW